MEIMVTRRLLALLSRLSEEVEVVRMRAALESQEVLVVVPVDELELVRAELEELARQVKEVTEVVPTLQAATATPLEVVEVKAHQVDREPTALPELVQVVPVVWTQDQRAWVHADFDSGLRRAALWGSNAESTMLAVQAFTTQGFLDDLLRRIWRFRTEIYV